MRYPFVILLMAAGLVAAQEWQSEFQVDKASLGVKGSNPYFNLTPGYRLEYKHGSESDIITVLDQIEVIDGVQTRVVEDRESKGGQVTEVTRDYYAIDARTNDVYYFGEDVDVYKNGKVAGHKGSWRSGVNGARFGLMMPGRPQVGQRFYQERAPGVGMDRVEIVSDRETVATPAGKFENCIHVIETTPLEKGKAHKWYAPGVGAVRDSEMILVKYGMK